MSTDPMAEIRASFFIECDELLESLQDSLDEIDPHRQNQETIHSVFRAVHSIKGGAGAFALKALEAFAHRFETVLHWLRAGRRAIDQEALKLLFHCADCLADQVAAAREGRPEPQGASACLQKLEALIDAPTLLPQHDDIVDFHPIALRLDPGADPGSLTAGCHALEPPPALTDAHAPRWSLRLTPSSALYVSGNDPVHLLRALRDLGAISVTCEREFLPAFDQMAVKTACLSWRVELPGTLQEAEIRAVFDFVEDLCTLELTRVAAPAKPSGPAAPATVRVELERIDRLVNLVGELVINQAMLSQSITKAGLAKNRHLLSGLDTFLTLTRDIQDNVMMIRAQPVKPLFQRMGRIVREAAFTLDKEVRLRTTGEMTEIDKTVIERLAEPLTHMIRNSLDHGIEPPDLREAVGKPREGVVTLCARHRAGRVVIEVTDDGAGIDRQKVLETAVAQGLVPPETQLSAHDIDTLLFLPGFSTAKQVSSLSGRGVGMDVVRRAIQALGGRLSIASDPGRGTKVSISLPLSLAVLEGMVIKVAGETLVVPLTAILETATLDSDAIRTLGPHRQVIHLRGAVVALYDLGAELGYRGAKPSGAGAIVLLVAQENGDRVALRVDTILGPRQVVIKGLAQTCGPIPGIAGATILGDGRVALILDPSDLVQNSSTPAHRREIAFTGS